MAERTGERGEPVEGRERGAVLLFTALALVALLTLAAVVTDIGLMRAMRRSNQSLVDLSALAAGPSLAEATGPDGRAACGDAVRYLRLNSAALAALTLPCATLPQPCDATTAPVTVSQGVGRLTVSVTYPVADATIDDAVVGGLRTEDGEPCERLRVAVERVEPAIFGWIVGREELRTAASSVVRQVSVQNRRVPSLWLLDPYGCNSLSVQGGSRVTVGTATMGGLISLDSDGSACTGSSYTIDVGGSGSLLQAIPSTTDPPGAVSLFAMTPGQGTCAEGNPRACDPADVSGSTLRPQPVRRPWRATRAPIDHVYNCRTSYPDYHGVPIEPCLTGTPAYVDQLRAGVGASGLPTGFQRWSTSYGCNAPSGTTTVAGNWLVDCSNFQIGNATDVVFSGGNVIFNGNVKMTGGSLTFNSANPRAALSATCRTAVTGCLAESSAGAAWVYMRSGNLEMSGGALIANRTAIYQHAGDFGINGGSPPRWYAPSEGPFAGLAVWSERSSSGYKITGGASMELEGVFFTPYANPFALSGGSPFLPQRAQFISYRAAIAGGAVLTLSPNSTHAITMPAPPVSLIR